MKKYILSLATAAMVIGGSFTYAQAQDQGSTPVTDTPAMDPGHPRINEVEKRIDKQEKRVDSLEDAGKITSEQAYKDKERLAKQEEKLKEDAEKHNGHITKGEQHRLNKSLNKNNRIGAKQVHHNKKKGGDVTPVEPVTPVN